MVEDDAVEKQECPNSVVQRKEAKGAVAVKIQPMMIGVAHVPQDAGDEETGEREEDVDAISAPHLHFVDESQDVRAGVAQIAIVEEEDGDGGKAAHAIERRKMPLSRMRNTRWLLHRGVVNDHGSAAGGCSGEIHHARKCS